MNLENYKFKNLLAAKYPMAKIHILYGLFALVFGYCFGVLFGLLTKWDITTILSINSLLSAGVYTLLYLVNNLIYKTDAKTIGKLNHNPRDQYFQAQLKFLERIKELKTLDRPDKTDAETLKFFSTVFQGQESTALAMYEIYKEQPFRFMVNLSEADREIIYRYYLVYG